ncbi:MAG: universal stress protein [Bacteroidales bacterium]|nr:universal stress protein [Bacteroidales bacterium]
MKTQINSILIPTDFSAVAEGALKVGLAIAKRQHAEITLLHVIDRFSYLQPAEVFLPEFQIIPDIKLSMEATLSKLAGKIQKESGIVVTSTVMDGIPSDCICSLAYNENFSLIVMGTHGTSGIREFFIGSEAFRVVKNATCPVLSIPGNWVKTDFEKVIFPIRITEGTLDKYAYARPIIEKNNSVLILLGLAEMKKPGEIPEISLLMDKIKLQLHNDNVDFRSVLSPCKNFPAKVIKMAKESGADLIVLTANFDSDFKAYFVGPFAQQVVNHSRLPVLSIKPSYTKSETTSSEELAQNWGTSVSVSDDGTPSNQ